MLAPRRAGSGSEAKHAAWVARVDQACRAFRSGRRGPAEKAFCELLEADKGNPVARKYLRAADWLLDLVKDLRETQPANQEARERVLRLVEQVDPARSDPIRELLAVQKALYKEYVARLFAAGDHERCVEICRQGLAAGIVSRTLRYRQAQSLLALKRYDEAEEVLRGLLEEKDYAERASDGLAKLAQARQRDGARPAAAASP